MYVRKMWYLYNVSKLNMHTYLMFHTHTQTHTLESLVLLIYLTDYGVKGSYL